MIIRQGNRGFTLVELIVVVVLLGLVVSFSLPRLSHSVFTNDMNYSARRIIGQVKGLREKAVREQIAISFNFDFSEQKFYFEAESGSESDEPFSLVGEEDFYLPAKVRVSDIWKRSSGKQSGGEALILISERGYTEQTIIHLKAADGREMSLELSPFLGTIRVADKYVDLVSTGRRPF